MTAEPPGMPGGLSRSDPSGPGIGRRRCGRGFRYVSPSSEPVTDAEIVARIKALVIPPAGEQVWICPDPAGHIQATGTDTAGRRQYLYHDRWQEAQDQRKYDRMLEFGRAPPRISQTVQDHLGRRGLCGDRVLAAGIRLVDLGFFRAGGEEYAADHGTFGLATLRRDHVACRRGELVFAYTAKGSIEHAQVIAADEELYAVIKGLKRRRASSPPRAARNLPFCASCGRRAAVIRLAARCSGRRRRRAACRPRRSRARWS